MQLATTTDRRQVFDLAAMIVATLLCIAGPASADPGVPVRDHRELVTSYAAGRYAEVIAAATRALAADPNDVTALALRGAARQRSRDDAGAATDVARALTLDPHDGLALATRAAIDLDRHEDAAAIADATAALGSDPRSAWA